MTVDATDIDVVETLEDAEVTPFTEGDREIAYRSDSAPSGAEIAERAGVIGPGYGTGRRKEAVARVRLVPGTGQWKINQRSLEDYFPNKVHQQDIESPLVALGLKGAFDVIATIKGGGITGQAGALRLGIARALNEIDRDAYRPTLKKGGLMTRDPRAKERKKAGLHKARKAPQYSKR